MFERRFATILKSPEQITPDMRDAFMVAWEAELREIAHREVKQAELDALEDDDGEPFNALPMTRAGAVPHAREQEDDGGHDDDGDGEESDDDGPAAVMDSPSIVDDDDYGAPLQIPERPADENDPAVILLGEWCRKFQALPAKDQELWKRTHVERIAWAGVFLQSVYLDELDPARTYQGALADFAAYSETVRQKVTRKANRLKARGLTEVEGDAALYLVPYVIPAEGPTMFHGHRKSGMSSLAHKLAVHIATDVLDDFDGVTIPHGRVLYASAELAPASKTLPGALAKSAAALASQCRTATGSWC